MWAYSVVGSWRERGREGGLPLELSLSPGLGVRGPLGCVGAEEEQSRWSHWSDKHLVCLCVSVFYVCVCVLSMQVLMYERGHTGVCTCECLIIHIRVYIRGHVSQSVSQWTGEGGMGGKQPQSTSEIETNPPNSFLHADRVGNRKSSRERIGSIYLSCLILLRRFLL